MPLIAEPTTFATERRRSARPHPQFGAEYRPVATRQIRDLYVGIVGRIRRSVSKSRYLRSKLQAVCATASEGICREFPNATAITNARSFLDSLAVRELLPSRMVPIPSGGMVFYFF